MVISNPVASELLILPKSGHGSAVSLQLIWRRDTALPSPLYDSDATGIDITHHRFGKKPGFFL